MSYQRNPSNAAQKVRVLLSLRHGAVPYDPEPANRSQRRQIAREIRQAERKQAKKGGHRG